MIYKFNNIVIKILILNKNFKNLSYCLKNKNNYLIKNKNNLNFINFFSTFQTHHKFNYINNKNNLNYFYYYNFFFFFFSLKNKVIRYKNIYTNFFKKKEYILNSFYYNINIKNNLYFYKNINKSNTIKELFEPNKTVFTPKYKRNLIRKIKFFKLKKNKDYLFQNYLNFYNFSETTPKFQKYKSSFCKFKFNFFFVDTIFFLTKTKKNKKKINNNQLKFKTLEKSGLYNILYFYKDLNYVNYVNNNLKVNILNFYNVIFKNENEIFNNLFNRSVYLFKYEIKKKIKPINLNLIFLNSFKNKFYSYAYVKYDIFYAPYFFFTYKNKIHYHKSIGIIKNNTKENLFINFKKFLSITYKTIIYLNDLFEFNNIFDKKGLLFSNFFFRDLILLGDFNLGKNSFKNFNKNSLKNLNLIYYNNYYPIFYSHKKTYKLFISKFKSNLNVNYLIYMNFYIISFLENFLKKHIFLKISNNFFCKVGKLNILNQIHNNYKNYNPKYMKNFSLKDFFEIIWYSFFLKDLNLLAEWFCKFMENVNFKVHKKFIIFFQNFIHKNQKIFFDCFNIKGFFFDIRGKVGVTGNSKKRHHFFKIGKINKSTKIRKMNFKQSVIRTPSGALGVTMIINY